jgi:site-specific recombinase XerD
MFLMYIHPTPPEEINESIVHRYMSYLVNEKKVSTATQNQAINAIKFYLEHVMDGDRRVYYTERPHKEWKLPTVLSNNEVKTLFYYTDNVKHRAVMFLLYSAALRMNELLHLKWMDLDPTHKSIYVKCGKGKRDRQTILSPVAYDYLMLYKEKYHTSEWVFEGTRGGVTLRGV